MSRRGRDEIWCSGIDRTFSKFKVVTSQLSAEAGQPAMSFILRAGELRRDFARPLWHRGH